MCSLTALISAVGSVGKKTLGGRTPHAEFRSRVWVKSADAHGKKETQTVRSERSEVIPGPDDKTLEINTSVATFRFLAVPRAWEKKKSTLCTFPSVFLSSLISAELQAGYVGSTGLLREQECGISSSDVKSNCYPSYFLIWCMSNSLLGLKDKAFVCKPTSSLFRSHAEQMKRGLKIHPPPHRTPCDSGFCLMLWTWHQAYMFIWKWWWRRRRKFLILSFGRINVNLLNTWSAVRARS